MGAPRLTAEAQHALDAAAAEALKAGHAEVTRGHVLRELVARDSLWPTLLPVRFYRREISAIVVARLNALPSTRVYRDGRKDVAPSKGLTKVLEELGRGIPFFRRTVDEAALLDALLAVPSIGALTRAARLDLTDVEVLLDDAKQSASARRHAVVHFEHIVRVALEQRWLTRAIHAVGGDSSEFRSRLDSVVDGYPVVGRGKEVLFTKVVEQLVARTSAHAKTLGRMPTSELFMVFGLQHDEAKRVFEDAEVSPWELLVTLVHGVDVVEDSGEAYVVFHNDDRTTQEFVTAILRQTFALDAERARETMLRVHEDGTARLGGYSLSEAKERVSAALVHARDAAFPLRITVHGNDEDADD